MTVLVPRIDSTAAPSPDGDETPAHFHWPNLGKQLSSDWSDRRLMGLPEVFSPSQPVIEAGYLSRSLSVRSDDLRSDLENPALPLATRLSAGHLLGLIGDPRIDVFAPHMCEVPAARVVLGLHPEEVDSVLDEYDGLGLERSWIEKETPQYTRHIAAFRIARYPVTNVEYSEFLSQRPESEVPSSWTFGRYPQERANHPVYSISAETADAYAAWLSETTARRFRLPSEAEWEYAAGGLSGTAFPWGDTFTPDRANTMECGLLSTSPVGAFPSGASCFGAQDMAGNVEEYVADNYRPYPDGPSVRDDLVEKIGGYRVARGGSFARFRDLARTRRRHGRYPRAIYAMGFRLAEDA